MEQKKKTQFKKHPKEKSNCVSHYFFWWQLHILLKSRNTTFNEDDLYQTLTEHRANHLGNKLEQLWNEEIKNHKNPSLIRTLWKMFRFDLCFYGLIFLPVDLTIMLLQPFCLKQFLSYFSQNETIAAKQDAYLFGSGFLFLQLLYVFTTHWLNLQLTSLGIKVKVACCSLVYRKTLKLQNTTLENFTVGQIVNLLSNDANRFNEVFLNLHYIWSLPIKLVAAVCCMFFTLGYTSLPGVVVIILCILVQMYLCNRMSVRRMQVAGKTDHRIRLMNDIISGIQTIKMYTWEKPFFKLIETARRSEIVEIFRANLLQVGILSFRTYVNKISIFFCMLTVMLVKANLTAEYYFPLINLYDNLNLKIVMEFQVALIVTGNAKTSINRIQNFLLCENDPSSGRERFIYKHRHNFEVIEHGVCLKNVIVELKNFVLLKDVDFRVFPEELVGLVGPPGSGKSTILQVILKELKPMQGYTEVTKTISYSSQESWIFSSSIRQNILFGQHMDEQKYLTVLRICALEHDLSQFPDGDQTLVGERGVMLSGGQKARINLARAVYRDADIYLLDDPLAAVDAHVAQHIFKECILGYLSKKCVVLITHRVNFLENAARVYFINDGVITETSTNKEIVFAEEDKHTPINTLNKCDRVSEVSEEKKSVYSTTALYKKYCFAGNQWLPFIIIFLLCLIYGLDTFITYFAALQTNTVDTKADLNFKDNPQVFLDIYGGICLVLITLHHVQSSIFLHYFASVSKLFHDSMLIRLFRVPIKFFNENVSGRILNRFSQDMGLIDEVLPMILHNVLRIFFELLQVVVIISVLNYWFIIPSVIMIFIFYGYGVFFEPISRNLRRLEANCTSPVFTHMVITIRGLTTIRASNTQKILIKEFDFHQDLHSSVFYLFKSLFYTFAFWVDITCFLYSALITFSFLIFENNTLISNVGLAVSQAGNLIGLIQYEMKTWSELDAQITSIERVIEYQKLTPEEDESHLEPPNWPQFGKIQFQEVSMRYYPEKPVILKNINIIIEPKQKVGIVGRTGAGKSSLVSVLFRLFHFEGNVLIDDVEIKRVPLSFLRSKIFIIPQDPVLFVATLRKNLDPFNEFSDSQLWNALESVNLKEVVSKLSLGLNTLVLENGTNFSVGQKQLLCLSRAILRNTKIVVFDEATANIDLETDKLIQSSIREKFNDCTVLTIAHRLDTVMDYDKILVMDDGAVVEFDEPEELLRNEHGFFYQFIHKKTTNQVTL